MKNKSVFLLKSLVFVLLVSVLFQACKKDEDLGLNIIKQPGDKLDVNYSDTSQIVAYSIIEDSIESDNYYLNPLGSYFDPVFGKTTASFYTQLLLSNNNVDFGNLAVGDSLVLALDYNGAYGDSAATHIVRVYEIDQSATFDVDSNYYSNQSLPLGQLVAEKTIQFNLKDSVIRDGDTLPPHMRIELNSILMDKFINASGTSDLATNDDFVSFFKGLYVTVEPVNSVNQGGIAYLDLESSLSQMTFYYHNDTDTLEYYFVMSDESARFSHFDHDSYNDAELGLTNQDTVFGINNRIYAQALGGVKIKIELPNIMDWKEQEGNIAVNRAELVLKLDDTDASSDDYTPAVRLTVARINDEGQNSFTSDFLEGDEFLGGYYDADKNEYRFRLTRHIQDLLKEKYNNNGLYILVSGSAIRADRVVLKGNTAQDQKVRLELTYTKLSN